MNKMMMVLSQMASQSAWAADAKTETWTCQPATSGTTKTSLTGFQIKIQEGAKIVGECRSIRPLVQPQSRNSLSWIAQASRPMLRTPSLARVHLTASNLSEESCMDFLTSEGRTLQAFGAQ